MEQAVERNTKHQIPSTREEPNSKFQKWFAMAGPAVSQLVAQIFPAPAGLYRRIAFCGVSANSGDVRSSGGLPIKNRRYSPDSESGKICATPRRFMKLNGT